MWSVWEIEIPIATRHRRDMTEKMLKATLNQNIQQQNNIISYLVFVKIVVEVESFTSHLIQIRLSYWQAEIERLRLKLYPHKPG